MSKAVTLHHASLNSVTLLEALKQCHKCFDTAVGLFYSPTKCHFGQVRGHTVTSEKDEVDDLIGVFEARIFNNNAELRWLQQSAGLGKAVLIFESNDVTQAYIQKVSAPLQAIHSISQQYILWGQGNAQPAFNGWSYLSEARIGQIAVPISNIETKERVALQVKEYLQECDDQGNIAVVEERLISLTKSSIVNA
jgi:CRISPR-associated protein (TIGR03984 family)